jgi:hypothetical protein
MSAHVVDGSNKIFTRLQVSERQSLCEKASVVLTDSAPTGRTANDEERQRMAMLLSADPVEMYTEQVCLAVGPFAAAKARVFRTLWQTQPQRGKAAPKLSVLGIVAKGIKLASEIKSEAYADVALVYALHQFGRGAQSEPDITENNDN